MIEYKCLCSKKKYYQKNFDEKLKGRFFNTDKFFNRNNHKFVLLLQKGVYHYEYMNDWEKISETALPEKKRFLESLSYGRYY